MQELQGLGIIPHTFFLALSVIKERGGSGNHSEDSQREESD